MPSPIICAAWRSVETHGIAAVARTWRKHQYWAWMSAKTGSGIADVMTLPPHIARMPVVFLELLRRRDSTCLRWSPIREDHRCHSPYKDASEQKSESG